MIEVIDESKIAEAQSKLIQTRVVYQDRNYYLPHDSGAKRWKPFILTSSGICYHNTVITIDQQELDQLKAINTEYGVFSLYPAEAPDWVFSDSPLIRFTKAQRHPVMCVENEAAIPAAIAILGLETGFSSKELKTAYRRLAKLYHPDGADNHKERFIEIEAAYRLLTTINAPHPQPSTS